MAPTSNNWTDLPKKEKQRICRMYMRGDDLREEAQLLGVKPASVERYCRWYLEESRPDTKKKETLKYANFPPPKKAAYDEYMSFEGDDAIIISDLEIPDQDDWMLRAALLVGMQHGIKRLIINGDIIATDQQTLNSWVEVWREEYEPSYQTAVDITRNVISNFGLWFEDIMLVSGNHDERVARKTGGEVYLGMLLAGTDCEFSRYNYMYMKTKRGWVHISHPKNYSKHSASSLGTDIWANTVSPEGSKCHIVFGHTHLDQTAWSPDGLQEIHATGCMRKSARYKDTSTTRMREWNRGFLMVKDGYFYHMTEKGTDWKYWLGKLASSLESSA